MHLPSHVQLQQVHLLPDLLLLQQRNRHVSVHHPNLSVHAIHLFLLVIYIQKGSSYTSLRNA